MNPYRVHVFLPIPAAHMQRISAAFPGAVLLTKHGEGKDVMVLEVPWDEGGDDD